MPKYNGMCLSSTLKKKHKEEYHTKYFEPLVGTKIIMPKKYYPRKEFLEYHMDVVFKKQ